MSGTRGHVAAGRGDRISRIIRAYNDQGIHRTGTTVDQSSASWLINEMRAAGGDPVLDTFAMQRIDIADASVVANGHQIGGVPAYDAPMTDAAGITGTIGDDIEVISARSNRVADFARRRRESRARAIIAVTASGMPQDQPAVVNAESFGSPFGPPVLQVAHCHEQALAHNVPVKLTISGTHTAAEASNVLATIEGTEPGLPPIVVMTPRSGWWQCASERGGGIAALLEMLRAVAAAAPRRSMHFTANTGHELGHTGLVRYLDQRQELIKAAALWIHLGANFGAAGGAVRLQFSRKQCRDDFIAHAARRGVSPASEASPGNRPGGEAGNIFDGGGEYLSIVGFNPLFHHPADVWPDAVDFGVLLPWIDALCDMALEVTH